MKKAPWVSTRRAEMRVGERAEPLLGAPCGTGAAPNLPLRSHRFNPRFYCC